MIPLALDLWHAAIVLIGALVALIVNPYWEGEE